MMKEKAMAFLAVALSAAFGLAVAEIFFRFAMPPVPGDEGSAAEYTSAAQRNPGAPRLFPAGYSAVFDIKGLYEGADKVAFRIGPNRFIPPEPKGEAKYKVLFLGGSVTEGIFLQDDQRWPGLLNIPGEIAVYNASMSEAGMLGQLLTAKYLAEHGYKFDLVVLATNHNDTFWSRRFAEIDSRYNFAEFGKGLKTILEKDFHAEKKESWFSLRTLAWGRHLMRVFRIGAPRKASHGAAPSIVVEALQLLQQGKQTLPATTLNECLDSDSPLKFAQLAYRDWKDNFPVYKKEIKRLLGAELMAVSEPASYGAPGDSFYFADLRVPLTCATKDGPRRIETDEEIGYMRDRARLYLDAARSAGVEVFDLAAAMEPMSNGPQGGKLFFDSIHPTPKGAEQFAALLAPAIKDVLEKGPRSDAPATPSSAAP
jgi:lysophospholipase L1-like esterase